MAEGPASERCGGSMDYVLIEQEQPASLKGSGDISSPRSASLILAAAPAPPSGYKKPGYYGENGYHR